MRYLTLRGGAYYSLMFGLKGELVFVQIVEVEVEQSRRLVGILVVERDETVAEIEWNGCGVCIDRYESAACLVVDGEVELDESQQHAADIHAFQRFAHSQAAYLGSRITLQPLLVIEAAAEAIVTCFVVKIGDGNAVVGETEEYDHVIAVASLENSICDGQFFLSVQWRIGKDEAVQILVATVKCGDNLLLNHSVNGISFCKIPVFHIT